MDQITVTPTSPYDRTLPELPKLDKSRLPIQFEILGNPWRQLLAEHKEAWAAAVKARSEYQSLGNRLEEARHADREALTRAALAGDPDPGRTHEMEALAEVEAAHRKAEALTGAANSATQGIRAALRGNEGTKAIAELEGRIEKTQPEVAEHATALTETITYIQGLGSLIEQIQRAQAGKGVTAFPSAPERITPVTVHGQPIDPRVVLDQLTSYQPRIDQVIA